MTRSAAITRFLLLTAIGIASCRVVPESTEASVLAQDEAAVYASFLRSLLGRRKYPLNVSIEVPPLTLMPEETVLLSKCTGVAVKWQDAAPSDGVASILRALPYVRPIDPNTWKQHDPRATPEHGRDSDSIFDVGFSNGLLSLSGVMFDTRHQRAALSYSFYCGGTLCGQGGLVVLEKQHGKWVRQRKPCYGWMS